MIGAHTDSPCLRVKPVSKKQSEGFLQVGVETYGGGLWHTWFDRDLSIAGRAMVKTSKGQITQKLVKIDRPSRNFAESSLLEEAYVVLVLRIPSLAIHLDRQETFSFNKETQLFPIAGLVSAELNRESPQLDKNEGSTSEEMVPFKKPTERHHPYLVELIAKEAEVDPIDVVDFEMVLFDTQKSCIGGMNEELMFSPRLDNLCMSFCSVAGLINSVSSPNSLHDETAIRLIALFDHEEIGSNTAQGADSNVLPTIIRRLSVLGKDAGTTAYEQSLASSFLISAGKYFRISWPLVHVRLRSRGFSTRGRASKPCLLFKKFFEMTRLTLVSRYGSFRKPKLCGQVRVRPQA